MQAHATDLRAEVARDWPTLVDAAVGAAPTDEELDEFVHQIVDHGHAAPLSAALIRLLSFVQQVTESSASCTSDDIAGLKSAGWSDAAIHDAVQNVSYFNYINRVADALGVEPEPDLPAWGSRPPDDKKGTR